MQKAVVRQSLAICIFLTNPFATTPTMAESPFEVEVRPAGVSTERLVEISVDIPQGHYLYAESWRVRSRDGAPWVAVNMPTPRTIFDPFSDEEKQVFDSSFRSLYRWDGPSVPRTIVVELQGCDQHVCFFPEERSFELSFAEEITGESTSGGAGKEGPERSVYWDALVQEFEVAGVETGYLRKRDFLRFLERAARTSTVENSWEQRLRSAGPWVGAGLILLGGLLLNLTPCVLPMIPINLAIIGASARAGTKRHGFAMGAVYGLGMALAYGVTGLVAVLTGSTFGTLNASPWFNAVIALLFFVLALAAFDVITIDFSRYQSRISAPAMTGKRSWIAVFVLGVVSALLAGACVAPVVIAVLLLTGALYSEGYWFAVFLPFLLGVGMALPWPLAGAGLASLPRPGKWMTWLKYGFGVFILGLSAYYGLVAMRLFRGSSSATVAAPSVHATYASENEKLAAALHRAKAERKPVFLDFWATWCKNCTAMEKTTFRDPEVAHRLRSYVVVHYQAEQPGAPEIKPVLQRFSVGGLPTYVVLVPRRE